VEAAIILLSLYVHVNKYFSVAIASLLICRLHLTKYIPWFPSLNIKMPKIIEKRWLD